MDLKQKYDIDALIALQKQMRHEDEHDNDCQASPRFWMIMDYREVVGNEDYNDGRTVFVHDNGDHTEFNSFEELETFIQEYFFEDEEKEVPSDLQEIYDAEEKSYDDLVQYALENLNEDDEFKELFLKKESFLSQNSFFLTKDAAKRHLEGNRHHYTKNAHTYAMTAWRSPGIFDVYRLLHQFDFESLKDKEDFDILVRDSMLKARQAGFESFMNYNAEVILDKKWNVYFGTRDAKTIADLKRKILSSLSYYSVKGVKPKRQARYLALLNDILGTDFDGEQMEVVYRFTGNGVNRELSDEFIASGFDMEVLYAYRRSVDGTPTEEEIASS